MHKFAKIIRKWKHRDNSTHHCPEGFDCIFPTTPSTGTLMFRLSNGDGEAMAWGLYL